VRREDSVGPGLPPDQHSATVPFATPLQRHVWRAVLDYLSQRAAEHGNPVHIDEEPPIVRARLAGETRDYTTIWFTVGERTLSYETYFMPDPEENHELLYRFLLRWNRRMYLASFTLDPQREVYLSGRIPLSAVSAEEIDHIVGQLYHAVESTFRSALRIGFPRLFPPGA
jgi:putative sensory transduction regulator